MSEQEKLDWKWTQGYGQIEPDMDLMQIAPKQRKSHNKIGPKSFGL